MHRMTLAALCLLPCLRALPAHAQVDSAPPVKDYNVAGQPVVALDGQPSISVHDAYVVAPSHPGDLPGYLTIENHGTADALVGVACSSAQGTTLNLTDPKMPKYLGLVPIGTSHIPVLEAIEIPAHATVRLKPGGMFIDLQDMAEPPAAGSHIPCILTFRIAGPHHVVLAVKAEDDAKRD